MSYQFRKIVFEDKEDVNRILNLISDVFGKQFSIEWWNWKYRNNPYGQSIGYLAICENTGDFAAVRLFWRRTPRNLKDKGVYFQPGDTATRKEHQRKGLAKKLIEIALTEHSDIVLYNFPNELSKKLYISCGWKSYGQFLFNLVPGSLVQNDSGLDNLEFNSASLEKLKLNREKQRFFKWRFVENPLDTYRYILINDELYIFTVKYHKFLMECRFVYTPKITSKSAFKTLTLALKKENVVPNFFNIPCSLNDKRVFGFTYMSKINIVGYNMDFDSAQALDYSDVDFV